MSDFLSPPYVNIEPGKEKEFTDFFEIEIEKKVTSDIDKGLATLRRQLLETAHSVFEKYLCHVVRVYLHIFPVILFDIDKNVAFRTIAELKDNQSIFDYIVEKEVSHFSRRSLQDKKIYFAKYLKHTHQDKVWIYEGEELWRDIDKKRQSIVHEEEIPEITHDYLLRSINHLQGIMMGIAIFAQKDQGVPFSWGEIGSHILKKDKLELG